MKLTSIKLLIIASLAILIFSCSTKKNRFLNRALHTTSTKYNVLYNGKVAYEAQKKQLDDSYEDDFWNILPIEPLKIEEKLAMPVDPFSKKTEKKDKASGGFAKAEEKAVKAVQKHSMSIGGKERNKQIDDAYFLLGKSRYYDQRFVPALETFKYIVSKYPTSPLFNPARVWSAKSLIRLGIEDEAIYKLNMLLRYKNVSEQVRHDAHTAMAMGYLKQDSIQKVTTYLDSTLLYKTKDHNQRARNLFILGQLHRQQNKIDSSNIAFDKLIAFKKAPYRFKIHAQLERAKNYNRNTDSTALFIKTLKKLARNRDNRPFLDGIYYQIGKIELANNNTEIASEYFEKSLRTKLAKESQKSLAYEEIGNIQFDKANFLKAGSYYDSVLNIAKDKNTKRIRKLVRKRKSLDEVIRLENSTHKNDSILDIVAMSKEEQTNFFNTYIEKLKKKDEEQKIIEENKKGTGFTGDANASPKQSVKGSKFYFYNTQTVGFGKVEFQKIWGERTLADNWRLSNNKSIDTTNNNEKTDTAENIDDTKKFDIDYYLDKIPTEEKEIDSITKKRNKAYYNLGLIYKEQFKKDKLATARLEHLIGLSPDKKMVLPIYYHLYKAFESFNTKKSDYYKERIVAEYPESRYAQIIKNPQAITNKNTDKNSPENIYKETYKLYKEEKYPIVLEKCTTNITQFANTAIAPKFELLKAYAIAKTTGREDFIKALTFVATNYPNNEEGKHAAKVLLGLKGVATNNRLQDIPQKMPTNKRPKNPKYEESNKINRNELPTKEKMLKLIDKNKGNMGAPPPPMRK